jgi:hypothetical protein
VYISRQGVSGFESKEVKVGVVFIDYEGRNAVERVINKAKGLEDALIFLTTR